MAEEKDIHGLRIIETIPDNQSKNINVHSAIEIRFDTDLNPGSIKGNIVILEDPNRVYKTANDLQDYSNFVPVKGDVAYADKVLTFTPKEQLHIDTGYIIMLNDKITSILGGHLARIYVSTFFTEQTASYQRVEIISPKYGVICDNLPEFSWKNVAAPSYIFQASKTNSFDTILYEQLIPGDMVKESISFQPDFVFNEGIYHVRIKAETSAWSDVFQFFIKPVTDAIVAEEDEPMDLSEFMQNFQEPIEVLEYFPKNEQVSVSVKTNVLYMKLKGFIEPDAISFEHSYVTGELFDEEQDSEDFEHGVVDGNWSVVYDEYFDVTYVIFTPVPLSGTATEYIETKAKEYVNANISNA